MRTAVTDGFYKNVTYYIEFCTSGAQKWIQKKKNLVRMEIQTKCPSIVTTRSIIDITTRDNL